MVGVHAEDTCSIPAGMGKYIPVQKSLEITGEVLIKTSEKTIPRLVFPDIKKKLGCIFLENHNPESIETRTDYWISDIICSDARGARSSTCRA